MTNKGRTPLLIAARRGHLDVVTALIRAWAHVDARSNNGVTPIFTAANKGHTAVVGALLNAGACPNSSDNLGYTPLFIACQHGHTAAGRSRLYAAGLAKSLEPNIDSLPSPDLLNFRGASKSVGASNSDTCGAPKPTRPG